MYVYERIIGHMDNLLKFSTYLSSYIKSPPWVSDNSMVWGFKPQWRTHWIMKLVCLSFSCFSNFVHETKTRFRRWGISVVWRTAYWPWRSVLSWWSLISTGRAVPSSRIDRRVDHTETCTSLGPTCRVGERPARGKDPLPIHEGVSRHVSSYTSSDCKDTGASGGSRERRTCRISWVGSFSALVDLPVRSTCSILMHLFIN